MCIVSRGAAVGGRVVDPVAHHGHQLAAPAGYLPVVETGQRPENGALAVPGTAADLDVDGGPAHPAPYGPPGPPGSPARPAPSRPRPTGRARRPVHPPRRWWRSPPPVPAPPPFPTRPETVPSPLASNHSPYVSKVTVTTGSLGHEKYPRSYAAESLLCSTVPVVHRAQNISTPPRVTAVRRPRGNGETDAVLPGAPGAPPPGYRAVPMSPKGSTHRRCRPIAAKPRGRWPGAAQRGSAPNE